MIDQLAAELNGHSVTDENGDVTESETVAQEAAPVEQTTENESTEAEKPAKLEDPAPQAEESDEENPVEDESGKRYVPEKRFKEIYAKAKEAERRLAEIERQQAQGQALLNTPKGKKVAQTDIPVDKADILELKMTHPQFNPNSDQYDPDLDDLGFKIWKGAGGSLTIIEAAKEAMRLQNNIAKKVTGVKQEARLIKSQQSDQGMTRVINKPPTIDINNMTDQQLEEHLRKTGQW
jgi:hypothetical protein